MKITTVRLFGEIEGKTVHPVYLLLGEDRGAKELFISRLRAALFGTGEEEDYTVFHGDEAEAAEVVDAVGTYSFLSGRKLVVVKDFEKLGNPDLVAETVRGVPEGTVLALLSDRKSAEKSVEGAVEKRGRSCIFWPMFEDEGARWAIERLGERGIQADRDALEYLIEVTGTAMGDLSGQIETVTTYLEPGEALTLERAKRIAARIYSYTVFDLSNALFVKPAREILMIFRTLVENGEELVRIEYFVAREVRKILDVVALRESGQEFGRVAELLGLRKREANRLRVISQSVSVPFLRGVVGGIASLDYTIKSSPRELCLLAFERLLAGLGRR